MSEPDHYRVLGLRRFASPQSVRQAYIALMKRHHPDAGATLADDTASRIARAYWELRHPERRAVYDARLRSELRRKARRHAVRLQSSRPAKASARRGTRLLFALSVAGVGALIGWSLQQ